MKAESEGGRQNEECRSGEKLGFGIRAQPLGCRGLRQFWPNRERRQIVESEVTVRHEPRRTGSEIRCPHQAVFGGWLGNLVEREGVIKCLTVRNLMSPGDCRNAAVHAATFSHFRHIEPSSGWVGCRRGEETASCLAVRAREAGCRPGRLGVSRPLRRCTGLRASRWSKPSADETRFGSRALEGRRF